LIGAKRRSSPSLEQYGSTDSPGQRFENRRRDTVDPATLAQLLPTAASAEWLTGGRRPRCVMSVFRCNRLVKFSVLLFHAVKPSLLLLRWLNCVAIREPGFAFPQP